MTDLFTPLTLRGVTFAHRAWMSPMMQYSAIPDGPHRGSATDWHLQHLGSRAVAGCALVMTEATAVLPEGRSSDYDLGLWDAGQVAPLQRVTSFIEGQGSVPGIQLVHAGRKASTGRPWPDPDRVQGTWPPRGPSPVAFGALASPAVMSHADIAEVVDAFAAAAGRAHQAGFRVLEIHGAHGYLIHQFLSPASNHRIDDYGGSLHNRMRLAIEVVRAVRQTWPADLPLFFRTSATDWLAGDTADQRPGWTLQESVALARELRQHGVDLLDVSSGGSVPDAPIEVGPAYQVPFAERIRREVGVAAAAVGMITEPTQAQAVIQSGQADAVFLGRVLLREPGWVGRAASEFEADLPYPPQYARAYRVRGSRKPSAPVRQRASEPVGGAR